MIFKIGLILTVFVTIPAFILGAFMYLVLESDPDDDESEPTCNNCNHCSWYLDGWYCTCEESLEYEREVEPYWVGCDDWESDEG